MRFKGSRKPLPEIAQDLKVDAVIEGSVQRAGGRVKITAQLIHAATDTHLWAREYEHEMADILKLESEVARAVAEEIRIQVTAEERARLASARSVDPAAHEAYLLGRYHLRKLNEDELKQAIEYFERAIQLAPDYAAAHAGLSDAWRERGVWGAKPFREVESAARAAALRALELDEHNAEAHISLCHIKYIYDWDWTGAEKEIKRALELDPNNLDAHATYANLFMALGRFSEAIAHVQSAAQLDPLSSLIQSHFGRILYRARKYDEAIEHLKRALELDPGDYGAYGRLGDVYEQIGKYTEAEAALQKAHSLQKGSRGYLARLARVYARAGRRREALRMIEEQKATEDRANIAYPQLAAAYTALGDKDEAFKLLMKTVEKRDSLSSFIKEDPPFDNLHSDPRWQALLRRMNFPVK